MNADALAELADLSTNTVRDDDVPVEPLVIPMHDCFEPLPENRTVDGYPDLNDGKCTFCSELCEPPTIDSSIGFFDGFDGLTVGATYAVCAAFTILWQIYQCLCARPKVAKDHAAMKEEERAAGGGGTVNKTASGNEMNLYS